MVVKLLGEKRSRTRKVEGFPFAACPLVSETVLRAALSNGCIIGESPASKATKFAGNAIHADVGFCSVRYKHRLITL